MEAAISPITLPTSAAGRASYQLQVHQASGMVMIQAGVTIEEAFLLLRAHAFAFLGAPYEPFFRGLAVLAAYWLVLWWMYRRRLFLKI